LARRDLAEEVLRRRDLIRAVIERVPRTGRSCQHEFHTLPGSVGREIVHSAVDGGHALGAFEGFSVYVARAWGRVFPPRGEPVEESAVGIVVPPENPEDRVSYYREALEALVAWRLMGTPEIAFFDGSIRGAVRWWRPGYGRRGPSLSEMLREASAAILEAVEHGVLDMDCPGPVEGSRLLEEDPGLRCVEEFIRDAPFTGEDRGKRPASNLLAMKLAAVRESGEFNVWWAIALEVAEKLYLYRMALEEAWRTGALPVFISKTSTGTRMCGGPQSDFHILRKLYPLEEGYVVWDGSVMHGVLEVTGLAEPGKELEGGGKAFLPRILGLHEFYMERMVVVEFYARLARGGPWLMIDLVLDGEKVGVPEQWEAKEIVEDALSRILSVPLSRGYPVSLIVAHRHARITRDQAQMYLNGLRLHSEPQARGMLNV